MVSFIERCSSFRWNPPPADAAASSREIAGNIVTSLLREQAGPTVEPQNPVVAGLLRLAVEEFPASSSLNKELLYCCAAAVLSQEPLPSDPTPDNYRALIGFCLRSTYSFFHWSPDLRIPGGTLDPDHPVTIGALQYFTENKQAAEPEMAAFFHERFRLEILLTPVDCSRDLQSVLEGLAMQAEQSTQRERESREQAASFFPYVPEEPAVQTEQAGLSLSDFLTTPPRSFSPSDFLTTQSGVQSLSGLPQVPSGSLPQLMPSDLLMLQLPEQDLPPPASQPPLMPSEPLPQLMPSDLLMLQLPEQPFSPPASQRPQTTADLPVLYSSEPGPPPGSRDTPGPLPHLPLTTVDLSALYSSEPGPPPGSRDTPGPLPNSSPPPSGKRLLPGPAVQPVPQPQEMGISGASDISPTEPAARKSSLQGVSRPDPKTRRRSGQKGPGGKIPGETVRGALLRIRQKAGLEPEYVPAPGIPPQAVRRNGLFNGEQADVVAAINHVVRDVLSGHGEVHAELLWNSLEYLISTTPADKTEGSLVNVVWRFAETWLAVPGLPEYQLYRIEEFPDSLAAGQSSARHLSRIFRSLPAGDKIRALHPEFYDGWGRKNFYRNGRNRAVDLTRDVFCKHLVNTLARFCPAWNLHYFLSVVSARAGLDEALRALFLSGDLKDPRFSAFAAMLAEGRAFVESVQTDWIDQARDYLRIIHIYAIGFFIRNPFTQEIQAVQTTELKAGIQINLNQKTEMNGMPEFQVLNIVAEPVVLQNVLPKLLQTQVGSGVEPGNSVIRMLLKESVRQLPDASGINKGLLLCYAGGVLAREGLPAQPEMDTLREVVERCVRAACQALQTSCEGSVPVQGITGKIDIAAQEIQYAVQAVAEHAGAAWGPCFTAFLRRYLFASLMNTGPEDFSGGPVSALETKAESLSLHLLLENPLLDEEASGEIVHRQTAGELLRAVREKYSIPDEEALSFCARHMLDASVREGGNEVNMLLAVESRLCGAALPPHDTDALSCPDGRLNMAEPAVQLLVKYYSGKLCEGTRFDVHVMSEAARLLLGATLTSGLNTPLSDVVAGYIASVVRAFRDFMGGYPGEAEYSQHVACYAHTLWLLPAEEKKHPGISPEVLKDIIFYILLNGYATYEKKNLGEIEQCLLESMDSALKEQQNPHLAASQGGFLKLKEFSVQAAVQYGVRKVQKVNPRWPYKKILFYLEAVLRKMPVKGISAPLPDAMEQICLKIVQVLDRRQQENPGEMQPSCTVITTEVRILFKKEARARRMAYIELPQRAGKGLPPLLPPWLISLSREPRLPGPDTPATEVPGSGRIAAEEIPHTGEPSREADPPHIPGVFPEAQAEGSSGTSEIPPGGPPVFPGVPAEAPHVPGVFPETPAEGSSGTSEEPSGVPENPGP